MNIQSMAKQMQNPRNLALILGAAFLIGGGLYYAKKQKDKKAGTPAQSTASAQSEAAE